MITREIIKNEGFKGMFRGLVPTFAREMPGKIPNSERQISFFFSLRFDVILIVIVFFV
jgi:hypothetical protein